jgi:hypothetical protein
MSKPAGLAVYESLWIGGVMSEKPPDAIWLHYYEGEEEWAVCFRKKFPNDPKYVLESSLQQEREELAHVKQQSEVGWAQEAQQRIDRTFNLVEAAIARAKAGEKGD